MEKVVIAKDGKEMIIPAADLKLFLSKNWKKKRLIKAKKTQKTKNQRVKKK